MQLIFATNNLHKIAEVAVLLPSNINIITLQEAGITEDIPEPFDTFRENAFAKAQYIYTKTGINCMAEDSGICVDALGGKPGVYSARYAGIPTKDQRNLQLLLTNMEGVKQRMAHYHSSVALIWNGEEHHFEGKCVGTITNAPQGSQGFGYDPIFIPEGYDQTFGELDASIKSQISHRKQSIEQMAAFLNAQSS